eukprot:4075066-Pyramimonas_sp.AAC.1
MSEQLVDPTPSLHSLVNIAFGVRQLFDAAFTSTVLATFPELPATMLQELWETEAMESTSPLRPPGSRKCPTVD